MPLPSNATPRERRPSAAALLCCLAVAGLAAWLIVGRTTRFEAWDSDIYFFVAVPLMFLLCTIAGYLNAKVRWTAGLAVVSLQFAALLVKGGFNPLAFIAGGGSFLLIALACTFGSWAGSQFDRKAT